MMSDKAELILGDCLEVMKKLPNSCVDMMLTDPPYGMSFRSNHRKEKYEKIENDSNLDYLEPFVSEAYRICKNNTAHYVFCSFHHIDIFKQVLQKFFTVKNILVWEKNNTSMGDLEGDFAPKVEFVVFLHKGRAAIRGSRDPNIFHFSRTGNANHPTENPVDMLAYLIGKFSDEGNLVFDPFMGSGSTGVASVRKKRRFLGIEVDKGYFDTAEFRIEESIKIDVTNTNFSEILNGCF